MATALSSPTRTTDLRERSISGLITDTGTPGSMGPQVQPSQFDFNPPGSEGSGTTDFGIGTQTITPENTLRNQRLDFEVTTAPVRSGGGFQRVSSPKTVGAISAAFDAQLPQLMQQFKDESRALAMRTAAMGRTGSGLFNRDTGYVGDRALQARESLLGNLAFQATQADANRALQAALGNQGAGLQSSSIGAQIAAANANRALQVDMARQAHFAAQQAREDQLARDAMANLQIQAMLTGQGFAGAPTGAVGQAAKTGLAAGQQFGGNAGQINTGTAGLIGQAVQALPSTPVVNPQQFSIPSPEPVNEALLRPRADMFDIRGDRFSELGVGA